ncbi:MAG: hypothetical protein JW751_23770 [Polyangiaceae bacterium]|nr:hypothetical protein [Polyangiaceae bacterium]
MRETVRPLVFLAIIGSCAALACSKKVPPPPRRTEPWQAASLSVERPRERQTFTIEPAAEARFEVPAREARPKGSLRVARGTLEVDLMDLGATRGSIELDLASIRILGADGAEDREASAQAQSWLDVGPSRPEADRERLRWARFTLREVERPTATAAHEGRLVRKGALPPLHDPAEAAGAAAPDVTESQEIREVLFDGEGLLLVHGFQVELGVRLRAIFEYAVPATPGAIPSRLTLETQRPFPVSLAAHDIGPRGSSGMPIPSAAVLLGKTVGKEARVSVWLTAAPAPPGP